MSDDLTGDLDARRLGILERDIEQIKSDQERIIDALEELARADGDVAASEELTPCIAWVEQASEDDWAHLMDWADWLAQTYDATAHSLFPCWPRHPGIVEDLAGLKLSWEHATSTAADSQWSRTEALAYWHDRYLTGFIARLTQFHGSKGCSTRHEERRARPMETDRDAAVVYATGERAEAVR